MFIGCIVLKINTYMSSYFYVVQGFGFFFSDRGLLKYPILIL